MSYASGGPVGELGEEGSYVRHSGQIQCSSKDAPLIARRLIKLPTIDCLDIIDRREHHCLIL